MYHYHLPGIGLDKISSRINDFWSEHSAGRKWHFRAKYGKISSTNDMHHSRKKKIEN